ncbi:transposase, TnpA family [Leptolyngbya sp. PCC 7375]|nr:transposase, TnpA family [Leptolyngbya sp. PCC 7375]
MPSLEDTAYPRLKSNPSRQALKTLYTPTEEEIALARRRTRGEVATLGFLVLLKTFQTVGYPVQITQVPKAIIRQVATTLESSLSPDDVAGYDASGTRRRHLNVIRTYLKIQAFGSEAHQVMVTAMTTAVQTQHDLVDLINVALEELVRQRFELPGFSTLVRTARTVRTRDNDQIYQRVCEALKGAAQLQLNELFYVAEGEVTTRWNEVKQEPGEPKLGELQQLIERLNWLKPLQVAESALVDLAEVKQLHFAAEAQALEANQMKELPDPKRQTLAAALLQQRYSQTLDDIAQVFIKRLTGMHYKAKDALANYRAESQQRTDELIETLRHVVIAHSTDAEIPERFAAIDQVIGERTQELIAQCDDHLAYAGNNYLPFLPRFYRSHRAVLFRMLAVVPLHSATQDTALTDAIAFIRTHRTKRQTWLSLSETEASASPTLDLSWVPTKWWTLVTGKKTRNAQPTQLHRQYFELCVFSHILLELKSGDLYIEGSSAFGDYYRQLLSWEEVQAHLPDYAQQMAFPTTGKAFVDHVKTWLAQEIEQTDQSFPANTQVSFQKDRLVIRKTKPKESKGAAQLKKLIESRIRPVNLIDVLVDTELWLTWTRHFKPVSGYEAKLENPVARYIATTFCYGCNIGPSQLAQSLSLFDRRQLARVNQRHITNEQLQQAIESIANDYNRFQLPKFWGVGKSASVDGTKWDIYENNLLAEYHIRYGGYGGIGYYHVADSYIALFSHFIPCGVFEAIYLFDGLLKNRSEIQPDTIHGDTHAQSLTVFGLAYLLGIKLMPRIRNWKDLTFYRADPSMSVQHLDSLFSETVDWGLIETHLSDMLRVVLSIKTGKISASTILRKLGTNSRKNKLFKAFHALGAAVRTGFLMQYINDVKLRSTIQGATNKSESFNAFVQWLAFGGAGILRTNNREEQRKLIKYNHLVANCLILYNVFEMSRILHELAQDGYHIAPEAIPGVNPYLTKHVIRLGQYHLDVNRQPLPIFYDLPFLTDPEAVDSIEPQP